MQLIVYILPLIILIYFLISNVALARAGNVNIPDVLTNVNSFFTSEILNNCFSISAGGISTQIYNGLDSLFDIIGINLSSVNTFVLKYIVYIISYTFIFIFVDFVIFLLRWIKSFFNRSVKEV